MILNFRKNNQKKNSWLTNKEISSQKKIIPQYFMNRVIEAGFNINLDSHHIGQMNFKKSIIPKNIGIEKVQVNNIINEMPHIYAKILNQFNFKYQTLLSSTFDKQDEDNRVLEEFELYINLKINRNITESDIDKNDVGSQLEQQIENQESKNSCRTFDRTNSVTIYFNKASELNGSSKVIISFKSSAKRNIRNDDKY